MGSKYITSKVLSNIEISKDIFKLYIEGDINVKPGQFYMLSAWEGEILLPRPVSIHEVDKQGIYFLYEVKGKGTKLLSKLRENDAILLLGPLGNGFDVEKLKGKVAVVTGGLGIAPVKQLVKNIINCEVDLYCGFKENSYAIGGLEKYTDNIYVATENGSIGYKGYVTDMIKPSYYDSVLCCGPEPMMKKLIEVCNKNKVPIYVSMERFMACGLGACLVCTCGTINGNKRTCKEGPVFLGEELIFDA